MTKLADIIPPLENRLEQLRELVDGFEIGQIFLTALELDIFSELRDSLSAVDLAAKLGTHAQLTEKLLNVLVGMNLVVRQNGRYRTTSQVAPFLLKDSPYFARYLNPGLKIRDVMIHLKDALYTGPVEGEEGELHPFNRDSLDWIARISMLGRLQGTIKQVTALPEFHQARKLIDLGGGHGLFAVAFAQENPNLQVILFDKPEVTPVAKTYIDKHELAERVCTMAGNYLIDDFGNDYDIVFEACSFGGNDEELKVYSRKVGSALKSGGLFIRQTFTLDDDRQGPLLPLLWDLKNHLTSNGRRTARTNAAIFQAFAEAGLKGEAVIDMSRWCLNPMRLLLFRKM